jgi:hypothetical protein
VIGSLDNRSILVSDAAARRSTAVTGVIPATSEGRRATAVRETYTILRVAVLGSHRVWVRERVRPKHRKGGSPLQMISTARPDIKVFARSQESGICASQEYLDGNTTGHIYVGRSCRLGLISKGDFQHPHGRFSDEVRC